MKNLIIVFLLSFQCAFAQSLSFQMVILYNGQLIKEPLFVRLSNSKDSLENILLVSSPGRVFTNQKLESQLFYKLLGVTNPKLAISLNTKVSGHYNEIDIVLLKKIEYWDYIILNVIDNKKLLDARFSSFERTKRRKLGKQYLAYKCEYFSDGVTGINYDIVEIRKSRLLP